MDSLCQIENKPNHYEDLVRKEEEAIKELNSFTNGFIAKQLRTLEKLFKIPEREKVEIDMIEVIY